MKPIRKTWDLTTLVLALSISASSATAQNAGAPELLLGSDAFEERVLEVILENPAVVLKAIEMLQEEQARREAESAKALVREHMDALTNLETATYVSNPDAPITVIEFYDYNCGFCKLAHPEVARLVEARDDIRVIYRELPILGDGSTLAAKFSITAGRTGQFEEFHSAALRSESLQLPVQVTSLTQEIGMDTTGHEELEAEADAIIQANLSLAADLGISGTPAFIIGDEFVFGFKSFDELNEIVDRFADSQPILD
jgi:protein-disulfide isomerase